MNNLEFSTATSALLAGSWARSASPAGPRKITMPGSLRQAFAFKR